MKLLLTEFAPRPIQSITCYVRPQIQCFPCSHCQRHSSFELLLLPSPIKISQKPGVHICLFTINRLPHISATVCKRQDIQWSSVCGIHCLKLLVLKIKFVVYSVYGQSPQLFQASILVGGWSVINGAYPVYFLPPGRDGVIITSFSSIQVVRASPALYKKTLPAIFEVN